MVNGSVSRKSKGFSVMVIGAVGGGRFVSSQYSGIRFALLSDWRTSSSLGRTWVSLGEVERVWSAHDITGAPPWSLSFM